MRKKLSTVILMAAAIVAAFASMAYALRIDL